MKKYKQFLTKKGDVQYKDLEKYKLWKEFEKKYAKGLISKEVFKKETKSLKYILYSKPLDYVEKHF